MQSRNWRSWVLPYVVPTLALYGSLMVMVAIWGDPDLAWGLFVAPPVAFLSGFLFLPEHGWIPPVATSLLIATTIIVATLMGEYDGMRPLVMLYPIMVVFVGLPEWLFTWLGKAFRDAFDPWWEVLGHRRRGPQSPAG